MIAKQLVLVTSTVLLVTCCAFGQGEFLKEGESGIGVALDFPFGDEAFDIAYNFGFSARNIMDVGLAYADFDELNAKVYAPYITAHLITPTDEQPLGTSFTAAYEWVRMDDGRTTRSEGTTILGPNVFANLLPPGAVMFQPSASLAAVIHADDSDDDIDLMVSLGMAVCFNRNGAFRPIGYIAHAKSGDESQTVFGAGFVTAW